MLKSCEDKGAKRIQNLLATKPFSADEIFVRNVQFVLDNNGTLPELKSASARLSFIHQFNLDIIILFGSAVYTFLMTVMGTTQSIMALLILIRRETWLGVYYSVIEMAICVVHLIGLTVVPAEVYTEVMRNNMLASTIAIDSEE
ncbi:hypothetical protein Ddc_20548 [Ditylenchus destructor]|nr:hypothetical protein Ddc_20548 [Ditylenchus destructor]